MGLVVEDGNGLANAESYSSVSEADTYHTARGNEAAWSDKDTDVKEIALRKATEYIDARFRVRFKGSKEFAHTQALEFPRECIEGYEGVPVCLKRATAEYALRALTTSLAPDPVVDPSGLAIVGIRKKVGPIETETTFASSGAGSVPQILRSYPAADMLLGPLLKPTGQLIRN